MFSWFTAHVGIYGNELADRLAKEAARSDDTSYEFDRIPKSTYIMTQKTRLNKNGKSNGQYATRRPQQNSTFPSVRGRIGTKLNLTPKLAAVLTGHGKTRAYLHRFNLREDARFICGQGDQTMDHLLFHCIKTNTQREVLKQHISQQGNWPASKQELISKHRKSFTAFIESTDFYLLQQSA
jgi:hypothetical protein